jgi:hypothetical protein
MDMETIKAAIEELSEPERRKLADWFDRLEERAWDDEIKCCSSPQSAPAAGHSRASGNPQGKNR